IKAGGLKLKNIQSSPKSAGGVRAWVLIWIRKARRLTGRTDVTADFIHRMTFAKSWHTRPRGTSRLFPKLKCPDIPPPRWPRIRNTVARVDHSQTQPPPEFSTAFTIQPTKRLSHF